MFTGIIEELGEVIALESRGDAVRLTVGCRTAVSDARHGDSIAVNGCCLTVVELGGASFTVDVMRESLDKTSLATLARGSHVNLERAVTAGTRLGGHIVQGHVDGTGTIVTREPGEHWDVVKIALAPRLARYVALKGSISVDGVSLTVSGLDDGPDPTFSVSLIPTTLAVTTLGRKQPGDLVNLEVDVIAKYVERLLAATAGMAGHHHPQLTDDPKGQV